MNRSTPRRGDDQNPGPDAPPAASASPATSARTRRDVAFDLPTRVLRAAVPATLAAGFLALYPSIAPRIIERLGDGFQPWLVTVYVSSLVLLFVIDAWMRDRRILRLRMESHDAQRAAVAERQRAEDLRFVVDVASEMNGRERLESALLQVLYRLRDAFPFEVGYVFLREGEGALVRRGVCPLTAVVSRRAESLAKQTLEMNAFPHPNPICRFGEPDRAEAVTCPIRVQDEVIGVIVLEQPGELREHDQSRLLAVADRLGASLNGIRLLAEVEARERALRHAYRELRTTARQLARSAALEQAQGVARAVSEVMEGPTSAILAELARLRDDGALKVSATARRRVEQVRARALEIREQTAELRRLAGQTGRLSEQDVNDATIGAVDLVLPDLKRSGIELRVALGHDLPPVRVDEGVLVQVVTRVLRRARASLRRAPGTRLISIETRSAGRGVRVVVRDNSSGSSALRFDQFLRGAAGGDGTGAAGPGGSKLRRALRELDRDVFRGDLDAHGILVESSERIGEGRQWTVWVRGLPSGTRL